MDIAWFTDLAPALDTGEQPLNAGSVAADAVPVQVVFVDNETTGWVVDPVLFWVAPVARMLGRPLPVGILPIRRYQVFRAGKYEVIRVLRVDLPG